MLIGGPLNQANVNAAYHLKVGTHPGHPIDNEGDEFLNEEMSSLSLFFGRVILGQYRVNGNEQSATQKLGELIGAIEGPPLGFQAAHKLLLGLKKLGRVKVCDLIVLRWPASVARSFTPKTRKPARINGNNLQYLRLTSS